MLFIQETEIFGLLITVIRDVWDPEKYVEHRNAEANRMEDKVVDDDKIRISAETRKKVD